MLSNLRQKNHSAVVLDYSLSLREEQERLDEQGIKAHRFDLHNPETSSRYNPFLHAKKECEIDKLADMISCIFDSIPLDIASKDPLWKHIVYGSEVLHIDYKDPFWKKGKEILCKLAVNYVVKSAELADEERTFNALYNVWQSLDKPSDVERFDISNKYSETFTVYSDEAFKKIVAYMRFNFEGFLSPVFECFTEKNDTDNISIEELGSELTYLFISGCPYFPTNKNESYYYHSACIDFLLSELINHLYSFAEDCFGGKSKYKALSSTHFLPYHVHFYLDEFKHRNIPNFLSILSTVRDYGIGFSVMVQNIDQLKLKYPNNEWLTVPSVCDTQIFLGSCLQKDYEYFATNELVTDIKHKQIKVKKIKGFFHPTYKTVKCMTAEDIKTNVIGKNKILVCVREKAPIVCDRLDPNKYT
jgi:hypothetical protein